MYARRHGEDGQYFAAAFTEGGLRTIAADHVGELSLAHGLIVDFAPDDNSMSFCWRGNDAATFDTLTLHLTPQEHGWSQGRDSESKDRQPALGIDFSSPTRYDNLDESTAQLFENRARNSLLDTRMGGNRILQVEAVALTGIARAIAASDESLVRGMLVDPDGVRYARRASDE
jgi:hypothetical protein